MTSSVKPNDWVIYGIRLDRAGSQFRYVGYTVNLPKRVATHLRYGRRGYVTKGKNNPLYQWMLSEIETGFVFEVIDTCPERNINSLYEKEVFWIDHYRKINGSLENRSSENYLLNITNGGGGITGSTHSEATRRRMSEKTKGRPRSEESTAKMKETLAVQGGTWKNKEFSLTHRERLSESRMGSRNPFYGKTHTEESRNKIGEANGGPNSYWYGKTHTEDTKQKMRDTAKTYSRDTAKGTRVGTSKVTPEIVREIRSRALTGESKSSIVRDYAISYTQVSRIIAREAWDHVD